MLALGTRVPDFSLTDVTAGKRVTLHDFNDKKALLVIFMCRHCPYVRYVQGEISRVGKDYQDKGVGIVAISSNDVENYPEDAPEKLKEQALKLNFTFPYLYDETQEVAKAFTAACTPDFFLFDENLKLVYRGQLDDARPGKIWAKVTGRDVRSAIEAILAGKKVSENQKPSSGCNIKWRAGNAPDYFN